jgi:peptide/nickel transport system substrate-binding protein
VAAPAKTSAAGGTVTFAEAVGAPPTYIFPLVGSTEFNVANVYDLVGNMYLQLYAFGPRKEPVYSPSLSVGESPVFSDHNTVVTVNMKHWRWSNGEPVTARDVIFWMNLLSAVTDPNAPAIGSSSAPGPGWGAAVPGGFPDNVVSYTQTGEYSVVFHLNASYNPTWFLYNELSQIYPLPQQSWDRLSATAPISDADTSAEARVALPGTSPVEHVPAKPGTATSGALGVAQFLNTQSEDLSTYATNPLWRVVDGPFKLTQFTIAGFAKFIPNREYSGSPKPTIAAFEEEPFTSDTAEFDALSTGSLTIGYIPVQSLAQKTSLEKTQGYKFNVWNDFAISYLPYNFTSPTSGPVFKQLYFRQAFQSLVNQPEYIKDFGAGIGSINNGPVPGYPVGNPDESPLEAHGQVYPYDPTKAVKLLKDNGWTVDPGGDTYCSKPGTGAGECGAGIAANQKASFGLLYASGTTALTNEMEAMQSTMEAKAGIVLNLKEESGSEVEATGFDECTDSKPCDNWDIVSVGYNFTWVYGPDFLPTGEELFSTGAAANAGDYTDAANNSNITTTTTAPSHTAETAALFKYQDYLAKQLPVVWMPNEYYQLTMYKSTLKGAVPQSVEDEIYPQFYSYKGK